MTRNPVIARSETTKQSIWIAILRRETAMEDRQPGYAGLAMTRLH
jgi:hypothetical protein